VAGIAVMFTLHLSVSFLLSLFYAARAWGLDAKTTGGILRKVLVRFPVTPSSSSSLGKRNEEEVHP
jgi:hypothetical protein